MILYEALSEKYRVQKRLSKSAPNIHEYFKRSHDSAVRTLADKGSSPNYKPLPKKPLHLTILNSPADS
jgi:hypothetical protein